jgi:hypothetical protein
MQCDSLGLEPTLIKVCATFDKVCFEGGCANQICVPDSTFCEGQNVLLCNATGTDSSVQQICGGAQFCAQEKLSASCNVCKSDEEMTDICGLNGKGTKTAQCIDGSWGSFGACSDPDVCKNGDTQTSSCGDNDAGQQAQECKSGQWENVGDCAVAAVHESCKTILDANASTSDGMYWIDPDGDGPIAPAELHCDMTAGGWTLVGNFFDSAADDMPNEAIYVVSGWEQTGSGAWKTGTASVAKVIGGSSGSAAVSLAFIEALGQADHDHIRMCFVNTAGVDVSCRQSTDGSLTLVSYDTGNPNLTQYANNKLVYTFGRLAGLAGSTESYQAESNFKHGDYCVPRLGEDNGSCGDKKDPCSNDFAVLWGTKSLGLCECSEAGCGASAANSAVWHGFGCGSVYIPWEVGDDELEGVYCSNGFDSDRSGFRIYLQ